ncbi:MAG: hypothetical protein WC812_03730 [Candidatus Pacearchaeota archaeon]|jgi:hypothetical protein
MVEFDDSLFEDDISLEAKKQKKILLHEKNLDFEKKFLNQKKANLLSAKKKRYFDWEMWIVFLIVLGFLIFLMLYLR